MRPCTPAMRNRSGLPMPDVSATAPQALIRLREPGALVVPAAGPDPRPFHASIPGYAATPLRPAAATARAVGVGELLVKDESARLGLPSFKVLGASWALRRAVAARSGADVATFADLRRAVDALRPLSLCTATDGNHGRAVAHLARVLDLDARIFMPAGTAAARVEAIAGEGAGVTVIDGGYDDAVALAASQESDRCLVIADTGSADTDAAPAWVIEGYATMLAEIEDAIAAEGLRRPDVVVVPIGVGALAAAVVRHFWAQPAARPRLMGVEPESAACVLESVAAGARVLLDHPQTSIMAGLNCGTPSAAAWPSVSQGIDAYVTVGDERVPDAMRLLARDGVEAGETGAAALAGLLEVVCGPGAEVRDALGLSSRSCVLLLSTEGATDPSTYREWVAAR